VISMNQPPQQQQQPQGQGPPGQVPPNGSGQPGGARPPPARPEEPGRQLLAKSRDLLPVLRNKWGVAMQEGGVALQQNANLDSGTRTGQDVQQNRFESSVEDFHSTIDQMELNLKCALETTGQSQSSSRYMLGNLSYQQYIATAKQQVTFTAQIREMLRNAAQDIVEHQPAQQN